MCHTSDPADPLHIHIFGSPVLHATDGSPIDLPSRRNVRLLLAFLLLHREPIARSDVARALWPELEPSAALGRLRPCLSHLRVFFNEVDAHMPGGLAWLDLAAEWIGGRPPITTQFDLDLFDAAADTVKSGEAVNVGLLDEAIEVSEEPLLLGFDEDWALSARQRAEDRRLLLLERRALLRAAAGEFSAALLDIERLLELNPLHELAHRLAIWCEWRAGSPSGAQRRLLAHEDAQQSLSGGQVEASADLQALIEALRSEAGDVTMPGAEVLLASVPSGLASAHTSIPALTDSEARRPPSFTRARIDHRDRLTELRSALRPQGLTNLIGPAGAGKSRLAAALFEQLGSDGRSLHWLDLARSADPDTELRALCDALAAEGQPSTAPIVILDNADAALDACADWMIRALRGGLNAQWLVTSRSPLGLASERRLPMRLLDEGEAVLLFLGVAGLSSDVDASSAKALVLGLGGLPAAIEWAALKVRARPTNGAALPTESEDPLPQDTGTPPCLEGRHPSLTAIRHSALAGLSMMALHLLEYIVQQDEAVGVDGLARISRELDTESKQGPADAGVEMLDAFEELVEHSLLLPLPSQAGHRQFRAPAFLRPIN